ncbi:MAG: methylenetetrahydrofolate--tRNA-(uracil(54)-C(5))-methyltransferase (FADH(2)-oxidizing) TrmFO [Oscillospiraceae bacterium]|jgi:methylenetetrahydrofolate--tRNA-(uracil-5-)-methyltransferase|nr:methylenetetrahydrofolate--tRNA-(uracil(54)-C(5))-methyltransferase (FADH(2)-oxidizing) TrmFO [Oscillospiraceae bacterium]
MTVTVIGAGLAGVEAACVLSGKGFRVELCEMKPQKFSPAHKYAGFAELVCSNSLKSDRLSSAAGLLKAEMRLLGSVTLEAARLTRVEAGGALAVDRTAFSDAVTERIEADSNIKVTRGEITDFPPGNAVIATGPLTGDSLAEAIKRRCGGLLSFYDAAAPVITAQSIDFERTFFASRYGNDGADYVNCPLNKDEYEAFYNALITAETAPLHDFDAAGAFYEGCMPVEVLAKRGSDSLRFGCMKPVGLTDPRTGRRPYANVQLRKENAAGSMYNLVGFQTNLKFGEQKRVFRMITGLENADFVRCGVMHRNTFIDSPRLLDGSFMLRGSENVFFAGQITGAEGYMESAASGIAAGLALAARLRGETPPAFPKTTMTGALAGYISDESNKNFQPMGANMGLLPPLDRAVKGKRERYAQLAERALADLSFETGRTL